MTDIIILLSTLAFSIILGYLMLPLLKRLNLSGHTIRNDGPKSHLKKLGTPLMGGFIFILPVFAGSIVYAIAAKDTRILLMGFSTLVFGAVGFLDDYVKILKKGKNGMGAKQKLILLGIVSTIFTIAAYIAGMLDGRLMIPYLGFGYYFDIGIFIIPFAVFVLVAVTNSVNLTDGIDGLAGTVTSIVLLLYIVITSLKSDWEYLNIFTIVLFSGIAGFLFFNWNPAKIFMGDSGSLALGGSVAMLALMTKTSLVLPVIGIVYFLEALSVIIQVAYFKKTGKRVFRMAPLHHHFELTGKSENMIVISFSLITFSACVIGLLLMGIRPF